MPPTIPIPDLGGGGGPSLPPTDTGEKEEEGDTLTPSNPGAGSWGNSGGSMLKLAEGEGFTTEMKIALGLCVLGVGFGMISALTMD